MSQGESFISEVAEEVRRDRMFRLWRRYGAYVIAAIFIVVAAGATRAWLTRSDEEQARQQMEEILAAIDEESPEETAKALDELVQDLDDGYQVLARFRSAAAHLEAGELARAGELYREIAAQDGLDPWFVQLAELKAVLADSETMSSEELVRTLRPHAIEGRIYRSVAQELLAGALVAAGEDDEALGLIEEVLEEPDLGGAAQRRLGALRDVVEARAKSEAPEEANSDGDSEELVEDDAEAVDSSMDGSESTEPADEDTISGDDDTDSTIENGETTDSGAEEPMDSTDAGEPASDSELDPAGNMDSAAETASEDSASESDQVDDAPTDNSTIGE